MNKQLTEKDFLAHLKNTIKFLVTFSNLYDEGFEEISMHIALEIRKLVYETDRQTPLLKYLNKQEIRFFDTSREEIGNRDLSPYLLRNSSHIPSVFSISKQFPPVLPTMVFEHYEPLLNQSQSLAEKVTFDSWWNDKEIIKIKDVVNVTRRDLIMDIADTDGGAHIDNKVKQSSYDLARINQKSGQIENGFLVYYANSVAYPSVRQIAHEVLMTLYLEYPDYFDDSYEHIPAYLASR